jgi:hypothetical protein
VRNEASPLVSSRRIFMLGEIRIMGRHALVEHPVDLGVLE